MPLVCSPSLLAGVVTFVAIFLVNLIAPFVSKQIVSSSGTTGDDKKWLTVVLEQKFATDLNSEDRKKKGRAEAVARPYALMDLYGQTTMTVVSVLLLMIQAGVAFLFTEDRFWVVKALAGVVGICDMFALIWLFMTPTVRKMVPFRLYFPSGTPAMSVSPATGATPAARPHESWWARLFGNAPPTRSPLTRTRYAAGGAGFALALVQTISQWSVVCS